MTKPKGIFPFDDYDLETLIVPMLILASPFIALVALLGFSFSPWLGVVVFGVELIAVPFVATNAVIREAGRKLEKATFKGTMPTTHFLLTNGLNSDISHDHNRQIIQKISGIKLLTLAAEKANPEEAKHTADMAINTVKEKLRDDFVLRRELKSYGYWRNMMGIRKVGRNISFSTAIATLIMFLNTLQGTSAPEYSYALVFVLSVVVWNYWIFAVNIDNYINSANRYAEQFFKSAANI